MTWDIRFLELALRIATWSKDTSSQVGAVIVDRHHRIISTGFNGYPHKVNDDYNVERSEKLRRTIHAETNAILFAQKDLRGHCIYTTHMPCANCAAQIVQTGIERVVALKSDKDFEERWKLDIDSAKYMLKEAGVKLDIYETVSGISL
jgi:dCMP deaminase